MDNKIIEDLARRLADAVPPGISAIRDDIEKNFRVLLQSGLTRMDMVTREEFEVQTRVLQRTREKLERLEARLQAMQQEQ